MHPHKGRVISLASEYELCPVEAVKRPSLRLALPLALLAVASGCATASGARPEQPKVVDIEIQGAEQLSEGDIKEKIVTTETPWWEPLHPFVPPNYFDPNTWQADLRRIERYYQARGYYQAQVEPGKRVDKDDTVALEVVVVEGQPTLVESLQVTGLEELSAEHRNQALAELPLRQGAPLHEEDWAETKALVQQRLRELGYAEVEVGGEVRVDVATQRAVADLRITPGPRYRFGNIFVATDANPKVAPRRIIEQAQVSIRKDEWFSESALADAQARVFRMGVFGAVKVNRGAPDREARTVPVVVDVREAPFHSIRLGGGVGMDPTRWETRTLAEWTDRNFFGGLRRLTLTGRLGYAFIPNLGAAFDQLDTDGDGVADAPDPTTPHGLIFELSAQFEQPRFLFRDLRLQSTLNAERGLEQAYGFIGGGQKTGVVWQPHPDISVFPSYNLEVYRLQTSTAGQRLPVDQTETPSLILGCNERGGNTQQCIVALSYLEQLLEWDRRNDAMAPMDGYYASLSLQEGGGPLLGDYTFLRLQPDVRYYKTLGDNRRLTVAARVRLGTLLTPFTATGERQQSAIVNRFFSGGSTGTSSMRGFNSRRLSPLYVVNPGAPRDELEFIPFGGNSLFESSVEARYRVVGDLSVAGFYDTGFVGEDRLLLADEQAGDARRGLFGSTHYHAVGLGLRYLTVVGPIRLDIGYRLPIGGPLPVSNPPMHGIPVPTCFGIDVGATSGYAGAPEDICTFHLSIGEAF